MKKPSFAYVRDILLITYGCALYSYRKNNRWALTIRLYKILRTWIWRNPTIRTKRIINKKNDVISTFSASVSSIFYSTMVENKIFICPVLISEIGSFFQILFSFWPWKKDSLTNPWNLGCKGQTIAIYWQFCYSSATGRLIK